MNLQNKKFEEYARKRILESPLRRRPAPTPAPKAETEILKKEKVPGGTS